MSYVLLAQSQSSLVTDSQTVGSRTDTAVFTEGQDAKIHLKNVNLFKIRYLKRLKYRIPLLLPLFESLDEEEDGERTMPDRSTRPQGEWHLCCWLALLAWVRFQPEHTR